MPHRRPTRFLTRNTCFCEYGVTKFTKTKSVAGHVHIKYGTQCVSSVVHTMLCLTQNHMTYIVFHPSLVHTHTHKHHAMLHYIHAQSFPSLTHPHHIMHTTHNSSTCFSQSMRLQRNACTQSKRLNGNIIETSQ